MFSTLPFVVGFFSILLVFCYAVNVPEMLMKEMKILSLLAEAFIMKESSKCLYYSDLNVREGMRKNVLNVSHNAKMVVYTHLNVRVDLEAGRGCSGRNEECGCLCRSALRCSGRNEKRGCLYRAVSGLVQGQHERSSACA
jgi:hypothetical protein